MSEAPARSETPTGPDIAGRNKEREPGTSLTAVTHLLAAGTDTPERFLPNNTAKLTPEEQTKLANATPDKLAYKQLGEISVDSRRKSDETVEQWKDRTKDWTKKQLGIKDALQAERLAAFQAIGLVKTTTEGTEQTHEIDVEHLYNTYLKGKSNVKQFISDLSVGCTNEDGSVNMGKIEQRMKAVGPLLKIFGTDKNVHLAVEDFVYARGLLTIPTENRTPLIHNLNEEIQKPMKEDAPEKLYLNALYEKMKAQTTTPTPPPPTPSPTPTPSPEAQTFEHTEKAARALAEIYAQAENKDKGQTAQLMADVLTILAKEKQEGKDKFKSTIPETAQAVHEYTREGEVVFIPQGPGEMVVVGDIHGDLLSLQHVLEKSTFVDNMESANPSMQIVFLGDLVDRGPKSVEVVKLVMELKRRYPKNVTILKADHEVYEGVNPHDFNDKIKQFFPFQLENKDEFLEEVAQIFVTNTTAISPDNPITNPDSVKTLVAESVAQAVIQPNWNIDSMDNPLTSAGVSAEAIQNIKSFVLTMQTQVESTIPVFAGFFQVFEELPRMTVAANGAVMAHGGPSIKPRNLAEFGHLSGPNAERTFDEEITWADPILETETQNYAQRKQNAITAIRTFLQRQSGKADSDLVKFDEAHPDQDTGLQWRMDLLKRALTVLEDSPNIYFNTTRGLDTQALAALGGHIAYSKEGLQQFLAAMGGQFMIRGHQPSDSLPGGPAMFDGMLQTIHTTGVGSSESYYGNQGREPNPAYAVFSLAAPQTKIEPANIRNVWRDNPHVPPPPRQETIEQSPVPVTNDDERLMDIFLHPEDRGALYSECVGKVHEPERTVWEPEKQPTAQTGIRQLFATELDGHPTLYPGDTLQAARDALKAAKVDGDPALVEERQSAIREGKRVYYQSVNTRYDKLNLTGDFLHFGVRIKPAPGTSDALPSSLRIYVTPQIERVGEVAAEVIRRAREQNFEPYGKVWDESTNRKPLEARKDRVLFLVETETQRKIIMDALGEIARDHPDYFETDPPLLTEKTKIKGVGLAEEPVQDPSGFAESFNSSREYILYTAFENTLTALVGPDQKETVKLNGVDVDKRIITLREGIPAGNYTMEKLIKTYRDQIRTLAPRFNVDPDHFSRNLSSRPTAEPAAHETVQTEINKRFLMRTQTPTPELIIVLQQDGESQPLWRENLPVDKEQALIAYIRSDLSGITDEAQRNQIAEAVKTYVENVPSQFRTAAANLAFNYILYKQQNPQLPEGPLTADRLELLQDRLAEIMPDEDTTPAAEDMYKYFGTLSPDEQRYLDAKPLTPYLAMYNIFKNTEIKPVPEVTGSPEQPSVAEPGQS